MICGSGQGMCIAANKIKGVRAALAPSIELAEFARKEDNANIVCLAARVLSDEHARSIVKAFIDKPFSDDERHVRRLKKSLLLNNMSSPIIVPAILTDSFAELKKQILRLDKEFDYIHLDVLDDTLVPGLTFDDVEYIRTIPTHAKFEVHFMVNDPARHLPYWENVSSVARVIFHAEASGDVHQAISDAKEKTWEVGIALNPETPFDKAAPYVERVDSVQFMTVHPGAQGAAFEPDVLKKIAAFTAGKHTLCSVDGAVSDKTAKELVTAGAEQLVVGSYFAKATDLKLALETLKKIV